MKEASAAENMKTVLQAVLPRLNEEMMPWNKDQ